MDETSNRYVRTSVTLPPHVVTWLRQEAEARARATGCFPSVSALVAFLAERAQAEAGRQPAMVGE